MSLSNLPFIPIENEIRDLHRVFSYKALAMLTGTTKATLHDHAYGRATVGMRNLDAVAKIKRIHQLAKSEGWI